MRADLSKDLNDDEIKRFFDELIRLRPIQEKYYIIAANRSVSYGQKKYYFRMAMERFKNDYFTYNRFAECVIDNAEEMIDKESLHEDLFQAKDALETSLILYNSISNEARVLKARLIRIIYHSQPDQKKRAYKELADEVWQLDKNSPKTYSVLNECNDDRFSEHNLKNAIEFYSHSDDSVLLEDSYKNLCVFYKEKGTFDDILLTWKTYESLYNPSDDFLSYKVGLLVENEYCKEAFDIINSQEQTPSLIKMKMRILSMQGKIDELDSFFSSLQIQSPSITLCYLEEKKDFSEICAIYSKKVNDKDAFSEEDVITYSYALLQEKHYKGCMSFLKQYYDNPAQKNAAIIINYLFAKKKDNPQYDAAKKVKELILEQKYLVYSDVEKVGAYALANMKAEMYSSLKKELGKNPSFKYSVKEWPVMENFRNDKTFLSLTSPTIH